MAERRMFAKTIIDSDTFLDMPLSTQALYFHLSMRADDDGFIKNPKRIQRMISCGDDDLKLLVAKNFIIPFESGVVVIKHWKIHNFIRTDRYKETVHQCEKRMLKTEKNKEYALGIPNGNQVTYQMETQVRLGKVSIDKAKEKEIDKEKENPGDKSPEKRKRFSPPTLEEVKAYCLERKNRVDAERFIDYYTSNGWQVGKNKMRDWKAAVRTWERSSFSNRREPKPETIWCKPPEDEDSLDDLF